jgi:hypothetical protein
MYDNETGRFTTPDLLWSAFPAQTPYQYAYNSPLTYRDPSGLAPEKEKEGDELLWLNPDDASGGYYFGIWNAQETDRSMAMTYAHNMIFAYLDMMYSDVCQWNDDFNTNFGSTSGGSRDGGTTSSATNGQGGDKTDGNTNGDKKDEKESEELGWFGKLIKNIFGVNEGDAEYAEDNPEEGAIVTRNASITGNTVDQAVEDKTFGNRNKEQEDEYDAYRHLVWSALNAWILGEDEARKAGNAHENFSGNNPESQRMDLQNNEIGYEIGGSLRNGGINNYMDALRIISLTAKSIIKSGNATVNSPIKKK